MKVERLNKSIDVYPSLEIKITFDSSLEMQELYSSLFYEGTETTGELFNFLQKELSR